MIEKHVLSGEIRECGLYCKAVEEIPSQASALMRGEVDSNTVSSLGGLENRYIPCN
jgi:hypothetical protein